MFLNIYVFCVSNLCIYNYFSTRDCQLWKISFKSSKTKKML